MESKTREKNAEKKWVREKVEWDIGEKNMIKIDKEGE